MEDLFNRNLKLVGFIYRKYFSRFEYIKDDLIQEGNIALWKSTSKYDSSKGEFSTFAGVIIKNKMNNYIRKEINYRKHLVVDFDFGNLEIEDVKYNSIDEKENVVYDVGNVYDKIIKNLKTEQQKIINDWYVYQNTYKVAEKNNFSRQYVCKIVNKFKDNFKEEYENFHKKGCQNDMER